MIIVQAKKLSLKAKGYSRLGITNLKGDVSGLIKNGVIPTLAPYLLPLFIQEFHSKNTPRVLQATSSENGD